MNVPFNAAFGAFLNGSSLGGTTLTTGASSSCGEAVSGAGTPTLTVARTYTGTTEVAPRPWSVVGHGSTGGVG